MRQNVVHLLFMDHSNVSLVFWRIQGSVKMASVDHIQSAMCPRHIFIEKYMSPLSSAGVAWSHLVVKKKVVPLCTMYLAMALCCTYPRTYKKTEIITDLIHLTLHSCFVSRFQDWVSISTFHIVIFSVYFDTMSKC